MDIKMREKAITRVSLIGIIANICLAAFKAFAGLLAGSIAVVLDAVNNLTDAMSSVITIAGIKLAKKHPDDKHPFGYGRVEYFSTILISLIILSAGVTSIVESVKKIIDPVVPDYSVLTIVIVVASVATKLVLGRFVSKKGEELNSDALVASGKDASFDAIISASTLLAALITLIFHFSVDGIIGAIISAFIIKAGVEMFLEAISDVLGNRADSEITQSIKKTIREMKDVIGAYDLVLHNYGPNSAIGSVHVEVSDEMSALEFHRLTMEIQRKIVEEYKVFLTVGIYAVDTKSQEKVAIRKAVSDLCVAEAGVINAHGFYIDLVNKELCFDLTLDFSIRDKKAFLTKMLGILEKEYPGFKFFINFDTNYSD